MTRVRRIGLVVLTLLLAGCSTHFGSTSEPPLAYRQAEDAFRLGDYERASRAYRAFLNSGERGDLQARAFYKLALGEYRRGHYGDCLDVLERMEKRFPREQWPQLYALRGDAHFAQGGGVSALHWWEEAWRASEGADRDKVRRRVAESVETMTPEAIESAMGVLTDPEFRALVRSAADEPAPARDQAAAATVVPGTTARPGFAQNPFPPGRTVKIGCLLPLSGSYATYGQRSLNGIRLALGQRAAELVVRDTAGDPARARAALDELAAMPDVAAVIGPLRSTVAEALAPRAERAGLPILSLSQRVGMRGRYVLPMALSPEGQSRALADYAISRLGYESVAVIHPEDSYGDAFVPPFQKEMEKRGGRVVGVLSYSPGSREFGVERLTVEKWRREEGLAAVFLPDDAATAGALASELRKSDPSLGILGNNAWNDPEQLGPHAAALEGAVFVDGFFVESGRAATRSFVTAYRGAFGTAPGILEAQAYDAAVLLRDVIAGGVPTRAEVLPRIMGRRRVDGASGTMRFQEGRMERDPFVIRIVDGTLREAG